MRAISALAGSWYRWDPQPPSSRRTDLVRKVPIDAGRQRVQRITMVQVERVRSTANPPHDVALPFTGEGRVHIAEMPEHCR